LKKLPNSAWCGLFGFSKIEHIIWVKMEEFRSEPQDLLMVLSVFVGTFSLEAAETVCIDEQLTKNDFISC